MAGCAREMFLVRLVLRRARKGATKDGSSGKSSGKSSSDKSLISGSCRPLMRMRTGVPQSRTPVQDPLHVFARNVVKRKQ